jgi:hypothetical protein
MATVTEIYCEDLHDNFQELYATWPPGNPLRLGDFGLIRDHDVFVRQGNIADKFGITFKPRDDSTGDDYEYTSSDSVTVAFHGKLNGNAGGGTVNAGVDIGFSSKNSVFFVAADCTTTSIEDQVTLGEEIMDRFAHKKWNRDWAIITSVIGAAATTVAVSGAANASISLEAKDSGLPAVNLADASIDLAISAEKNIGLKLVSATGTKPLIGLAQVQPKWHVGPFHGKGNKFGPRSVMLADSVLAAEVADPGKGKVERLFYFGHRR